VFVFAAFLGAAGCAAASRRPRAVLEESAVRCGLRENVSIPLLRIRAVYTAEGKERSLLLTGRLAARWPDKMRVRLQKANHHLVTLVVNGHDASLYFPRTNKVLNAELHTPACEKKKGKRAEGDLLPHLLEMSTLLVEGSFPRYPLRRYGEPETKEGLYVYTARFPDRTVRVEIDPRSCMVRKQVCVFPPPLDREVEIAFDAYRRFREGIWYPTKISFSVSRPGAAPELAVTLSVSRISFNRPVPDAAFTARWPDATVIRRFPDDPKELFGLPEEVEKE